MHIGAQVNTPTFRKSLFSLPFTSKNGEDTFLQNPYAKLHGVTSQMTGTVIVIAKITLNFTNTNWFQKLRISDTVKIFLYKHLVVKILFHICLEPPVKKYRCPYYRYHGEGSFIA
jgi:hypothetical protein